MKLTTKSLVFGAAGIALLGVLLFFARRALRGNPAARPAPRSSAEWQARHQHIVDQLQQGRAQLLWIGDSIVERFEGPGRPVWDHYYAPRDAVNMGISSDRTQHVLWRLEHCPLERLSPKLAIVMIGQNNAGWCSAQQIAGGVTAIVTLLRQKLPSTKILLLGIFLRRENPNAEQIKLAQTNDLISRLDDHQYIHHVNINSTFVEKLSH